MAGGHVCSFDPICHNHSPLKTIDNTAKWQTGILLHNRPFFFFFSFNCLLQQNTDYWKFTLNATVSFTRCTIVKMGEDRSAWKRWRCWSRYGRLDGGTNFKCNPSNISHYFRYGPQGETVALKVMHRGMLFWMHLFIHLFKQSKPCIASTSELCILSGSNSDMFWDLRAGLLNEQTSWTDFKYCHKKN